MLVFWVEPVVTRVEQVLCACFVACWNGRLHESMCDGYKEVVVLPRASKTDCFDRMFALHGISSQNIGGVAKVHFDFVPRSSLKENTMELRNFQCLFQIHESWSPQGVYDTDEKPRGQRYINGKIQSRSPPAFETDMILDCFESNKGEKTSSGFHHLGISFSIDNNPTKTPTEWYK
jgi:hypothetical protein